MKKIIQAQRPPQEDIKNLLISYQSGKFEVAQDLALLMSKKFPEHPLGWKVLGALFGQAGKMDKALVANQNVVRLDPKDINAHFNLGVVLKELGKLEQAEASYSQAINLRPDYADAHNNLGSILKNLGKFKQAEVSYRKAIALMPDYADAHQNMAIILYINGDIDSALESMEKANSIDSKSKKNRLLLNILYARRDNEKKVATTKNASPSEYEVGLSSNPLILKRIVEPDLIKSLYKMNSRELDKSKDARYGNGRCSLDFDLFEDDWSILKIVSDDLIRIMTKAVKSEVYVYDSFFNILGAGGGSKPHDHINNLDKDNILNLRNQKYSLVYYLSAGDQSSSEPGTLKLYDPDEDILPYEGMIVIIPASRKHSAVYDGSKDRVMIGINFYSL